MKLADFDFSMDFLYNKNAQLGYRKEKHKGLCRERPKGLFFP